MLREILSVLILILVIFFAQRPAYSLPDAKIVQIEDVPGLPDYLTRKFKPAWRKKQHVFLVRLLDLDEKPDGIEEVLFSVVKFDQTQCFAGCPHAVLVPQSDGSLKEAISLHGYDLRVADTYTNGVRDLVIETFKYNRRINLAGKTSGTRDRKQPDPNIVETAASGSRDSSPYISECFDNSNWRAARTRDGGTVSLGSCGNNENWFQFSCTRGSNEIEFVIENKLDQAQDGMAITVPVFTEENQFNLQGQARFGKAANGPRPVLRFNRRIGLFEALKDSRIFDFTLEGKRFDNQVNGANDAIDFMLKACDGLPGGQTEAQASPVSDSEETKVMRLENGRLEYRPGCHNRSSWFGSSIDGSGSVTYGGCGDGEYWFQFSCSANAKIIHLTIESILKRARDGMALTVPVVVDGKRFNLRGKAQFSEMLGGAHPNLTFDRKNGLMEALMSASKAAFLINREEESFHLHGAKGSIETMLKGCSGAGEPPSQTAAAQERDATATRKPVIVATRAHVKGKGFGYSADKTFNIDVCKGTTHVEVVNRTGRLQEIWMGPPDSGFVDREIKLRNGQKGRIDLYRLTTDEQLPEYTVLNAKKDFSYRLRMVDCDAPRAASANPPRSGQKPPRHIIPFGKAN